VTAAEAAAIYGVSVRLVKMGRYVLEHGRDLGPQVMAGKLTMTAAYNLAKGKKPKTSFDKLLAAWKASTPQDQVRLIFFEDPELVKIVIEGVEEDILSTG